MTFSLSVIPHLIIMSAEFIIRIIVNGFLIIVSCNKLIRSRKLTPMPLLLICVGMSRLGLQPVLWTFFSSVSLWFATCLSVFYSLKLIGFTRPTFLWLKYRIPKLMPWLLLKSLLTSVSTKTGDAILRNATRTAVKFKVKHTAVVLLVSLALIFPLAIFVMCTLTLLISLYKHTLWMQNGSRDFRSVSTDDHIKALRTVLIFFLFFISYFAASVANMTFIFPYGTKCHYMVKDIMEAYPSGHSVVTILSNSKFQQPFRRLL
ncbi:LOW QUALITY PROTEIN: taste receptor type 2 member 2-like [Rhynchonycteris naso]